MYVCIFKGIMVWVEDLMGLGFGGVYLSAEKKENK